VATQRSRTILPYYVKHRRKIDRTIQAYRNSYIQKDLFCENASISIFNALESGILRHRLRYYQLEALFTLDYIYTLGQAEKFHAKSPDYSKNPVVTDLMETIDTDTAFQVPFIGYEMATGSGKTMLIGACIYLLNKKYDVKNFLIIAPSSLDIYRKTIRNFTIGGIDSIWADETPFTFNLVTGDNYTESLLINYEHDANIFVFNIDKFGANAVNTDKAWESSQWQDESGNTVCIREYLRSQKLVIITDEAHHTQGQKSMNIIKKFHPEAVLEFTATAVEQARSEVKRNQQIVYKYDIRRFLEDGHGKLVRAVALASSGRTRKKNQQLTDSERLKLITLVIIHLLKKRAVLRDPKVKSIKPVAFVKVKNDTQYTQIVFDYIRFELAEDTENLSIIIEKAASQDLEITSLVTELIQSDFKGNIEELRNEVRQVCNRSIFYYGKSDKMVVKQFLEIRKNDIELVIYMEKLDEGIDLPNIYTMAVVNDTVSNFKTSVKQIIGRGVRLAKEKREFDEEKVDILRTQAEKLHVVCDQGKNFEEVILAIQQEFGLNDKYLSMDKPRKTLLNRAKSDHLAGRYLPHIKADFKVKPGAKLMDLVHDIITVVDQYLEANCFAGLDDSERKYLKYRPESFFLEIDVFANRSIYHQQLMNSGASFEKLSVVEKAVKDIYGIVQKNLLCLPDTPRIFEIFSEYIARLNTVGLLYPRLDAADERLALNHVIHTFAFFYRNHIEKHYYELDFRQVSAENSWSLKQAFTDYEIKIPEDQEKSNTLLKVSDRAKLTDLIKSQYHFYGYENSIFDYVKFDTYTEKQLADYVESITKKTDQNQLPFWIRNERQIHFSYGTHRYFPDFIVYNNDKIYVIETKGEIFSDARKNLLLAELSNLEGYEGVLVYSDVMNDLSEITPSFEEFLDIAADSVARYQSKANLEKNPLEVERFRKYIPVYQPYKAYQKYLKKQRAAMDGWLEVLPGNYPDSYFAIQVKGAALSPTYRHNDWIILNSSFVLDDCLGKLVLIHHDNIKDCYSDSMTLRQLDIESYQVKMDLLQDTVNRLSLQALHESIADIVIDNVSAEDIKIVGISIPELSQRVSSVQ